MEHVNNIIQNTNKSQLFNAIRYIRNNINRDNQQLNILFASHLSLAYMTTQIKNISYINNYIIITQSIMGTLNLYSVMPTAYIEKFSENYDNFTKFLDIFNHSITSKFYKSWARNNYSAEYSVEQLNTPKQQTPVIRVIQSLTGKKNINNQFAELSLYFSAHLSKKNKTSNGLKKILSFYFNIDFIIQENHGEFHRPNRTQQLQIGNLKHHQQFNHLGKTSLMGKQSWNPNQNVRIILNDINYDQYVSLHPTQNKFLILTQIINNYLDDAIAFSLLAIIQKKSIISCKLAMKNNYQLGFNSWLSGRSDLNKNIITLKKQG